MLTGCKSDGRVHDKNYLRAVGIDGDTVTMAFFDGSQVTVDGSEPEKARKSAEIKTGKEIFTGYTELILMKDCDRTKYLEFFLNKWKVSPECTVATADSPKEVLEKGTAETLRGSVKRAVEQGKAEKSDIVSVLTRLTAGEDGLIPEIDVE